jgi:nicotinamidase-related amidase
MSKTALIVLDMINGITQNEAIKPYLEKHQVIEKVNQLIAHARKNKQLVIFVKVGFSDSYVELAYRSPYMKHLSTKGLLKLSEQSTTFDAALDYRQEDIVVVKHRINAFYSTSLEAILNANDIDQLILCGISTHLAVDSTARDAHDRNYSVIVAKDACAASIEENHEKSLSILSLITAVKTADEICIQR